MNHVQVGANIGGSHCGEPPLKSRGVMHRLSRKQSLVGTRLANSDLLIGLRGSMHAPGCLETAPALDQLNGDFVEMCLLVNAMYRLCASVGCTLGLQLDSV